MRFLQLGRRFSAFVGFSRVALLLTAAVPLWGQETDPIVDQVAGPGAELTIYHVTMGPGDLVYEKFEHNAIWVHDPLNGTDHVYNYGMFDFDEPGYWGRFVRGDWLYWLGVSDIERTLNVYQYFNRTVSAQELNLTPAQRNELRDFLEWNAREENRFYRYDYFLDNCSTRIRDALDSALGGALRSATGDSLTGTTFRWHSERLVADDIPTYTGLLIGLGPAADREITGWEEMFLPGKVQEQLRRITVPSDQGGRATLVVEERVLYRAVGRAPLRSEPPKRVGAHLLVGLVIGGTLIGLALIAHRSRVARLALSATAALWSAFVGTGGLLLFGLWAFTSHVAAHRNENLLQFNPLVLVLIVLVPAVVLGASWAGRPARLLTGVVLALSIFGLFLGMLPGFDQVNGELIALALPAHLGLAGAVWLLARNRSKTGTAPPNRRAPGASRPRPAAAR